MAEFVPESVDSFELTEDGNLKVNIELPKKTFSSGKKGFFKQGIAILKNGKKVRINFQIYETS